ncbi:hypothetical protein QYE76_043228 [Lolium multiflorum]|uniref:Uncharacterized protein n=1 Tax=Lolium multiflorum TaxID=4521 RepID=A0AAD8WVN3_LOLMU|nr:hypothetical protein QYE76_043228 [Lolium multiflorum]
MIGWRGQGWARATLWCRRPSTLLRRLFTYLKPPSRKPYYGGRNPQKPSRAAAIAKPRSGGQESLFRHPAGRGSAPEGFSIDTAAISTAIFITAAAPMRRSSSPSRLGAVPMDPIIPTEPFLQTQVYDLANGGDLIFERDLFALTDFLGRTPPVFYGGQISDNGQLQWLIMANLPGKPESPMFRQIQFSLRENTWVDGLAHALQESLARLCGQNSLAIEGERFAHFARHSSVGLPLSLPYHPVLRHHVDHLDYMLYETRSALSDSRSAANHTQQQLNQYAETIKVIAKERRTLRQLVAKRDATIHRLKTKIAVLKETISTQVEQLQILEGEGEGEDIQGDGYSYVSNDNDYEPEEEGDDDFHQTLPAGMDTTFPLRIDG